MMSYGHVPASFGRSYTIPLPKGNAILSKALMVDDFMGVSCPVLSKIFDNVRQLKCSKIFEHFIFLATTDNQFGFKKGWSHSVAEIFN